MVHVRCNINSNGNNIVCDSIEHLTVNGLAATVNNNNPITVNNNNPITPNTPPPGVISQSATTLEQGPFCCHTTMPAFELWNGYCLMVRNQVTCDNIPNNRCVWKSNDCFPDPQCIMREETCSTSDECCSKVCLFQSTINGVGG